MSQVLLDQVVHTDYRQFDILWAGGGFDGDWDRFFDGQVNGLAGAASGDGLYLNLARRSGGSPLMIVRHDSEPPIGVDWEDVVEVSLCIPRGVTPAWMTWGSEGTGPIDLSAGSWRVRVSARGRDAGSDGELAEGPVDWYLVDAWPAPAASDAIIRTTSADAAYWHSEVGCRR